MAKPSKKVVLSILDKLGLEHSSKITLERAQKKVERAIEKDGIPEDVDMTAAEIKGLEQMGFEIDTGADAEPTDADLEDLEDDEPAPTKKKKSSKKDSEKKEPKPKKEKKAKKSFDRITAACKVLQKKKNHTFEEYVDAADQLYADNGGKLNPKEALPSCRRVLKVLQAYEMIAVKGEKIKVLS